MHNSDLAARSGQTRCLFCLLKFLKLEVDSKMAFHFPLLGLLLREAMAKIPKPQCRQLSNTQVNAEKSPKTVIPRVGFF